MRALARDPERLPAGRQDVDPRHAGENRRRQAGRRLDDMLAIVEQQQHSLVSKTSDQPGKRILGADFQAEHRRNRARHQARVAERRQIGQPHAVFVIGDHALGDGEGDRRLADTTRPDDRHQALARQSRHERRHRFLAADHSSRRERQIVRQRDCRPERGPRWFVMMNRGDEIVAPPRNGGHIAMAALSVAESAPQRADLHL